MFSKTSVTISSSDEDDKIDLIPQSLAPSYSWQNHESEGQLAIDVAQTEQELIIIATMSGTVPDNIGLHLHDDLLTIRGERISPIPDKAEYIYEEAYWGKFSRTIVLPNEVKHELVSAEYKNGILKIVLPKRNIDSQIPITVIEE